MSAYIPCKHGTIVELPAPDAGLHCPADNPLLLSIPADVWAIYACLWFLRLAWWWAGKLEQRQIGQRDAQEHLSFLAGAGLYLFWLGYIGFVAGRSV